FDLVSPEQSLASVQATEVQIPGAEGDLTAMEGHTPTITTLRPGILRASGPSGVSAYVVTEGFAEITATSVSVLAERAVKLEDVTSAELDTLLAAARDAATKAIGARRDAADKLVADFQALRVAIGH
ncbi:MAG: F0F1 ATP synthase subunit epsilon, partial [Pseudorhodobacter sp.]|nr:F0F1 ATP synthase subunit epsilon [Pseudorhodobacter sp.]